MNAPTQRPLRVLQVSAELAPYAKTGGLADVTAALPDALRAQGVDLRVLLPGYPSVRQAVQQATALEPLRWPWGRVGRVLRGELPSLPGRPSYVLDAPDAFDRPGTPYATSEGVPFPDNLERFAALSHAAAWLGSGGDGAWWPDVVHAHDWHTGLACAWLALAPPRGLEALRAARSVFTIHNLAYQGLYPAIAVARLGLPAAAFQMEGLEFHGQLSCMKAGLHYANAITTVSPSYALEIQTPEQGCGLDGLLRRRADELVGVLNGVDDRVWNPATDKLLPARFDAHSLEGKAVCKAHLQQALGLEPAPQRLLLGVVSRLVAQKGLDLVVQALNDLLGLGAQLAVLGQGDATLEAAFRGAAQQHPGRVSLSQGMDEAGAHRLVAGCDVLLVPSRFEPCGLTQLYGLAYGSLPLVRRVGGLADTVVDCSLEHLDDDRATGFVFERFTLGDFRDALRRACVLWSRPEEWRRVQRRAMAQRFGWDRAAEGYLSVYRRAIQ